MEFIIIPPSTALGGQCPGHVNTNADLFNGEGNGLASVANSTQQTAIVQTPLRAQPNAHGRHWEPFPGIQWALDQALNAMLPYLLGDGVWLYCNLSFGQSGLTILRKHKHASEGGQTEWCRWHTRIPTTWLHITIALDLSQEHLRARNEPICETLHWHQLLK